MGERGRWPHEVRVQPDVRPSLPLAMRALSAGAVLGAALSVVLLGVVLPLGKVVEAAVKHRDVVQIWGDASVDAGEIGGLAIVAVVGALVGAGVALLTAFTWRLAVIAGAGRLADPLAGAVAVLATSPLWFSPLDPVWTVTGVLLTGTTAALVARWQGYERDRPARRVTPTSSNAPSAAS